MKNKTTYWALGILGAYTIIFLVIFLGSKDMYAAVGYAIFMAYAIGLEVLVLMVLGLLWALRRINPEEPDRMKTQSKHFFLAALIVLLVGFSLCFGGGALIGE